ncbi:MAG: TolC family outer membrane protein [Xanthomonadales bacterium]|nr:TolC family outer membrane protein [Xanthomonadales bacterium]
MRIQRTHFPRALALALSLAIAGPASAATDLLQVFELARTSDPSLQAADANRLAASEGVPQARARLLPQVSGTYTWSDSDSDGTRSDFSQPGGILTVEQVPFESNSRSRNLRVDVGQTIYDHSDYTQLRGARADAARADADYDAAFDNLLLRVTEAYFGVLTAQDSLSFAEAEEKAVRRQLDQAEQRFEVGLSAITDVHEARARADASRASVILARNGVDDAYEALAEITGQSVDSLKRLQEELPLDPPDTEVAQWVDEALQASPTLRARTLQLESSREGVETAKAGHYPTLEAFLSYSDSDDAGDTIYSGELTPNDQDNSTTTIGVRLNVPIFAGGATQSRVRQAIYNREAAIDNVEAEKRAVTRSVRNAYRAVLAGLSEVQARNLALVSARSALEATEAGFEVGTRTIVDVLISQQQLFQAQRDYSQARHNLVLNRLRLKQATGTIDFGDLQAINALLQ